MGKDRTEEKTIKICMIVPEMKVRGGIASVTSGYRNFDFGSRFQLAYVESYCDGSKGRKLIKALLGYLHFCFILLTQRPDIVHIHSSFGPSFYRKIPFIYLASWAGIKIINHIHGADFDSFYENASAKKKARIKQIYGKCSLFIVLSGQWEERIKRIDEGFPVEVLENYCLIPSQIKGRRRGQILFLGAFEERKGCYDIPRIYAQAVQKTREVLLVMAGDGEMEKVKAAFGSQCKVQMETQRILFPGWVRGSQKEKLLQESEIFLLPSYHEGMPMAVLEAMAYGMAVITTAVGGLPQLIEDGKDGCLCRPGDSKQVTEQLAQLIGDRQRCRRMGEAARKKAIERYSMESHIHRLKGIYHRILG